MVKSYRAIQQWNRWLNLFLGKELLETEKRLLLNLIERCYGKHAVLIGVPNQYSLLEKGNIPDRMMITPFVLHDKNIRYVEGDWNELPISSGSVDLVVLPHSLEYVDNPREVLAEACRIIKPEGSLIIFGFNPHSLWGLRNDFTANGNYFSANKIKKWLALADFELLKQKPLWFRPPIAHEKLFQKLKIMEWVGEQCRLPFGGAYVLMAKAKVIPLTPIRLNWQQQLAGAKLTITGPSIRNVP